MNQSTDRDVSGEVRRAGRPRTRVLTRERIVVEALALLDRSGPQTFTIGGLANRLGVAPSAIYNHVGSKRELMILVQDHLIEGIDFRSFETKPWDDAVRCWASSAREVFAGHAALVPMYAVMPVTDSRTVLAMYEAVIGGFAAGGWPVPQILSAVVAVESFILGSALDANAPKNVFDAGEARGDHPALATAVAAAEQLAGDRADRAFELGLDVLVDGLRALLDEAPTVE